ncbi:MAG: hypothetical protein R3B70_44970 [Polyangiaceae bacterium]
MTNEEIVAACRKHYTAYSGDCSAFVRAVTAELGHAVQGNANGIMSFLASSSAWEEIDRATAATSVHTGALVIAGLRSSDHNPPRNNGHVVIVVDGTLYRGTYPMCWGGSIGSAQSRGTKSVGEVWNRTDRDAVRYYRLRGG